MTNSIIEPKINQSVTNEDLKKYSGKWFEIASTPNRLQNNYNFNATEYTLTNNGNIKAEYNSKYGIISEPVFYLNGKTDIDENATAKSHLFWIFQTNYWIIDLADDLSYAVITNTNKRYLWILSRTVNMKIKTYQQIIAQLKDIGFEVSKLQKITQLKNKIHN